MGAALELLTGSVVAPGATLTALTMAAGNSLTIRNTPVEAKIKLLTAWVKSRTGDRLQIRSPLLHDNVRGIRVNHVVDQVYPLLDPAFAQPLKPQDTLTVELAGSATAGSREIASLLVYYEDLPGVTARLITPEQVRERMVSIVEVENTITAVAGANYSGEEALNAEVDLLHANTDYALLGYLVLARCGAVRWRGAETGNLGVGGPGEPLNKNVTRNWFVWLSERTGLPLVPVFNSANRASIFIDVMQDESATAVRVDSIFAELRM